MGRNMNKLVITTILLTATFNILPAFAVIDTERLLNENYLRNAGYSPATINMINAKIYDPYSPYEEEKEKRNIFVRFKYYIDPASDNGRFGRGIANPDFSQPDKL